MIYKDSEGNEFESVKLETNLLPTDEGYIGGNLTMIRRIKKPKWSVEWHEAGVLVKIPDDSIKVNEKIKASIEALIEYIYGDNIHAFDYSVREAANDAREAIGDKDG